MYYWRGPFIRSLAIYGNDDSAPWLPPIYQYTYAHMGVQCTLYSVHFGPGSRYVDRPRVMNFEGVPCVKGSWKRFLGHIIHRACTDRWKRTDFLRHGSMDCNKLAAGSIFKLQDREADFLGLRGANSRFKGRETRRKASRAESNHDDGH